MGGHASGENQLVVIPGVGHTTSKSIIMLNLHKAYNIRIRLFVESLVSDPSAQAWPRKQEKEGEQFQRQDNKQNS